MYANTEEMVVSQQNRIINAIHIILYTSYNTNEVIRVQNVKNPNPQCE